MANRSPRKAFHLVLLGASLLLSRTALSAPQLQILLPLQRIAYQTNEQIDLSIVRSSDQALPAGDLTLTLVGRGRQQGSLSSSRCREAGSRGRTPRRTDHLHLDGRLLAAGAYTHRSGGGGLARRRRQSRSTATSAAATSS